MKLNSLVFASAALVAGAAFADADILERQPGIKIGQRMTLRPYVAFSCTFDSNPDTTGHSKNAVYWTANPGFDMVYQGENWQLDGVAYYQYHQYTGGRYDQRSNHSYGEQLTFKWSNIDKGGPGWALLLSERFMQVKQSDSLESQSGDGLWRDRQQFSASGALQRRFTDQLHLSIDGSYYMIDYDNNEDKYSSLYGYQRWTAAAQAGYTLSKWTDLFLQVGYQGYRQDNHGGAKKRTGVSDTSRAWMVHGGFQSYLTERIDYKLAAGWTNFEYGDEKTLNGFTYQGSLRWKIGDTWSTSLLISSYYHPSERSYGSATRTDSISWGLTKSLVQGKVNTTLDISYRHENHEYSGNNAYDYDLNLLTARLGVNYRINRIFSIYARGEYQDEINGTRGRQYDYERWRATLGLKLTY